jgi:hypothetical protein
MSFIQLFIGAIVLYTVYRILKSMINGIKERRELDRLFS